MGTQLSQVPVVFLSFDEPYADAHFKRLADRIPAAKRVHGVKGFDAAHKAAAEEAGSDQFITVDADCMVLEEFWHVYLDSIPLHLAGHTLSWRSFNVCNGLQYGNGGLKLWTRDFVMNMRAHEASEGEHKVDFCWDKKYTQLRPVYSVTDFTSSPFHAYRAGYREGAKMPLVDGTMPPTAGDLLKVSYKSCLDRLVQWSAIGRDINYGAWAMLGTIEGLLHVHVLRDVALETISDYDNLREFYKSSPCWQPGNIIADPFGDPAVRPYIDKMLKTIHEVTGLHIPIFGPVQGRTVKQWLRPTQATNAYEEDSWLQIHW